jgi:catechol 2,3-dioxygenase-like lactoylglutathione lyase family enzyme
MITGFNHTSFTVADLDTAVRFWTEALGFEAASVSERSGDWQGRVTGVPGAKLRIAHLYGYGHHMEFIQYLEASGPAVDMQPNMPGVAHVCLEVRGIDATARRLADHGATPQGEVVDVTSGPVTGMRAGYFRDPSGIVIELLELPKSKENVA